jgi:hypothetical protein
MRSAPKLVDVAPPSVVRWKAGVTLDGQRYDLPVASIVTSRAPASRRRSNHYALVCKSASKLKINPEAEAIVLGELRNLLTGRPAGASQVTAIVQRSKQRSAYSNTKYLAAIEAELVFHFLLN